MNNKEGNLTRSFIYEVEKYTERQKYPNKRVIFLEECNKNNGEEVDNSP